MSVQPVATSDELAQLRRRYLVALDAAQAAGERTIDTLVAAREARELARRHAEAGRPMIELEDVIKPESLRTAVHDALADLERTRHDAQRLLFQLLRGEGVTLADIARGYGISRQLVSRLVNEPDPPRAR